MSTRLRINKLVLIRDMREARERLVAQYEAALEDYPKKLEAWQKETTRILKRAQRRIDRGLPPEAHRSSSIGIPTYPTKPTKKEFLCKIDSDLVYVARAVGDELTVTQDEYAHYTRQVCR